MSSWGRRLKKLISILLFSIQPNAAYKKWQVRSESEAVSGYLKNVENTSNDFLYGLLREIEFSTLCEVGSNVGNRIINLAKLNPNKLFFGSDINDGAVKVGSSYIKEHSIANISLGVEDLSKPFESAEGFDVVLSWATLVIFPPKKIDIAVSNIAGRAKSHVVLIERMIDVNQGFLTKQVDLLKGFPNYAYDYEEKFSKHGFYCIHQEQVPGEVWAPGGGRAKAIVLKRRHSL